MTKAKYYIYRNLTQNTFSVKYKGRVIAHHDHIVAHGVQFRVNELGRQRVINEKKKYVHAYVVCDSYETTINSFEARITSEDDSMLEVSYNPFKNKSFMLDEKEIKNISACLLTNNKVYVYEGVLE